MLKLYYIATTRAVRPRWLLEEMEVPYELIRVVPGMSSTPEFKKLHPHGKVPILVDDSVTIYESAAICAYLADQYLEKGFAPALDSSERGYYYQWLFYGTATLEPPVEHYMFKVMPNLPEKVLPAKVRSELSTDDAKAWFDQVGEPLRDVLSQQPYLISNRFTAADVVIGGILMWALRLGMLTEGDPLKTYIETLMQRPGFKKADEDFYAKIE